MNKNQTLVTQSNLKQGTLKTDLARSLAAEQPAVNELCQILARILRRVSHPDEPKPAAE